MATPPHLLTIPRELRDNIYEYLHREAAFYWVVGGSKLHCARVEIERAPILNALIVCHRLREEYLESGLYRNLSMFIRTYRCGRRDEDDDVGDDTLSYTAHAACIDTDSLRHCVHNCLIYTSQIVSLLCHVKHIKLHIEGHLDDADINTATNGTVLDLAHGLEGRVPSVLSIKIGVQFTDDCHWITCLPSERTLHEDVATRSLALMAANPQLLGLPLNQTCAGFRTHPFNIFTPPESSHDYLESLELMKFYVLFYTKNPDCTRRLVWSPAQFSKAFPFYRNPWLDNHRDWATSAWVHERYGRLMNDVVGWLEKSGEALHDMKENTTK